jgi:serine O-acetyltransferase
MKSIAVVLYRLSHRAGTLFPPAGAVLKQLNHFITGADIAFQARFGPGLVLLHPTGVVVATEVVAGARCNLGPGVTLGSAPGGAPLLGDDVDIAAGASVLGPRKLGDRVRVGANSVVTHDFEDDVVIAGVPATVLRPTRPDELV